MASLVRCTFTDVTEHDMDLLFLEEFACSETFLSLFTYPISISNARVLSVHSSLTDSVLGESDMTVILDAGGKKIGLLIENKIDAIAMPEQAARYNLRGAKGIARGDYEIFFVFIIAPQKYLNQNHEAQKYPHKVSYEEVQLYFEGQQDSRASFKLQQIRQAIEKQKKGYQVEADLSVTDFWRRYALLQEESFPNLNLIYSGEVKGANASWPRFQTKIDGLYMYHKTEMGCVDLTFDGCADKILEIDSLLKETVGDYACEGFSIHKTGKAAAVRLTAPTLDLHKPFEEQKESVEMGMKSVLRMAELSKMFPLKTVWNLIHR